MLYPLQMAAPDVEFIPANAEASCQYMKMITLPKLRDALREMQFEVRVPEEIAVRARVPIDRMVAIGGAADCGGRITYIRHTAFVRVCAIMRRRGATNR